MTDQAPAPHRDRSSERPPKRSIVAWALLLPLALLAGVLWQAWSDSQQPPEPLDDAPLATPQPRPTPKPTAKPTPEPTAKPTPADTDTAGAPLKLTLFLPGDDAMLHPHTVTHPDLRNTELPTAPSRHVEVVGRDALELLLQKSPEHFPKGTRLLGVTSNSASSIAQVNLSKEFARPDFWQGSARTLTTVYSIVNTLAAIGPYESLLVQLLIEGKPIDVLGELDVSEPLEPNREMVAAS